MLRGTGQPSASAYFSRCTWESCKEENNASLGSFAREFFFTGFWRLKKRTVLKRSVVTFLNRQHMYSYNHLIKRKLGPVTSKANATKTGCIVHCNAILVFGLGWILINLPSPSVAWMKKEYFFPDACKMFDFSHEWFLWRINYYFRMCNFAS